MSIMIGLIPNHILTLLLNAGLFQKFIMKIELKNILSITLTSAKSQVKELTDSQIKNLITKLNKLSDIVRNESDKRYEAMLIEDAEQELEDQIEEDEVQEEA